jgi:uncharacterized protein
MTSMGTRESYAPNSFCWVDLITTDATASKEFYAAVLGWTFFDLPTGAEPYSMAMWKGRQCAALYSMPREGRESMRPAWQSYVSVESAANTCDRVEELGGRVVEKPFPVLTAGTLAIIQDPAGAFLSLWEPAAHKGAAIVNEPNTWCWSDLQAKDLPRQQEFYQSLFGWRFEPSEEDYVNISLNGRTMAGAMITPSEVPMSHWHVYFNVSDIQHAVRTVEERGGRICKDIFEVTPGPVAVIADPQGAVCSLIQLKHADD